MNKPVFATVLFFFLLTRQAEGVILNFKASYPENYSAELGLVLPANTWGGGSWSIGFPGQSGPAMSFEVGTLGNKIHLGYGEFGNGFYAMRLTGFYMWEEEHRHVGIQGFVSLVGICGAVGVMRRTDKDSYTVTLGFGFGW